ncbi:MAG: hypothetical protein KDB35_05360 [Acidimicrobiales bacterium]|nr:hypothetical protein [Acidimicrobiales bacterium]
MTAVDSSSDASAPARLGGRGCRLGDLSPRDRRIGIALAALVAAPFVIAALQAIADGWFPTGDNGTMLTVARQVFTTNTPLTGEVASGTRYGAHPFHPGPLVYYFLAPFVEVFGGPNGLLLGAAFVSSTAMVLIGYSALRTAGRGAAIWAWVVAGAMCWSLGGTAFLYPPFKTTLSLVVILLFLFLCAALLSGQSGLLPLWVVVASFPAAATMRYALPVLAVAGSTLLVLGARRWHRTARVDERRSWRVRLAESVALDGRERRSVLLAVLAGLVCWWAPIYEAVTNGGGNVRELYRASRVAAGEVDGLSQALGEQAKAMLFDPVMSAAAFHTPSTWYLVGSAVVLGATAFLAVRLRHRIDRGTAACLAVATLALVFMLISLATTPSDEGFGIFRTLASSPVAAFVWFAAGLVLALGLGSRIPALDRRALPALVGALVVVLVLTAVPGPIDADTEQYPWASTATRQLVDASVPDLGADGQWQSWVIGGRTIDTVFIGYKAGLEAAGVYTGIDARAPGLRTDLDAPSGPVAGSLLLQADAVRPPGGAWRRIAHYEPEGRDPTAATESAERLAEFARETNPRPLAAFEATLPRLLCPELAASGFQGECPEVEQVLASDNPVAELDPAVIALAYLVQFGDDTQFPIMDGPRPPEDVLEAAAESWDDVPISVYILDADGG